MAVSARSIFPWAPFVCVAWLCALLQGCASRVVAPNETGMSPPDPVATCRAYFASFDELVARHGTADHQAARIADFPYLRVNRFLAVMTADPNDDRRFRAWITHMQRLDREARRHEFANLPQAAQRHLSASPVEPCGDLLRDSDLTLHTQRLRLLSQAVVPDNYSVARRVLGLYPLTALLVRASITHWQNNMHRRYAQTDAVARGQLRRYTPPATSILSTHEVAELLRNNRDELGIPIFDERQRTLLFETYAPVWEIDTVDDDDIPGRPHWSVASQPEVDTTRPSVYTHLSYMPFEGEVLPQLNYIIWFRARPPATRWDLLAGRFDGIQWRVTLGLDGRPLIYDSIHPCGCYHLFFPSTQLNIKTRHRLYEEPILIPQRAPRLAENGRVRIRVSSRTHYIEGLRGDDGETNTTYEYAEYDALRSLPLLNGESRSLFAEEGYIPDTQRAERWLLWPMGIARPGAMRQWGMQPTAFIGRRHYDEPSLLDTHFSRDRPPP